MSLSVIILAAGQGKRMCSLLPKVLHPLAGKPLVEHVVHSALQLAPEQVLVVYGHGGEAVPNALKALSVLCVEQAEQHGTGHAVSVAMPLVSTLGAVLILYGDVPLITTATLQRLLDAAGVNHMGLLTATLDDPRGYGRVVRDAHNNVVRIVEEKDATPQEREIKEINTGIMAVNADRLRTWLGRLKNDNAQGEYYLTDIVGFAVEDNVQITTVQPDSAAEVMGVNTKAQLAELERVYQRAQAERYMLQGVTIADPARFDLRGELSCGREVTIDVNVVLEGKVALGDRVRIGPNNYLRNVCIGDDVEILPNCVIEDAALENGCRVGPFARIRPQTKLAEGVHIGNFVEVKKSTVGARSKINHLSYVGDSTVGKEVNVGAGTITCNYDGANKHQTVIGDGAFIGSGTELVAPVEVGAGATIGAGSTITSNAPAQKLTLTRVKQQTLDGWQRPGKASDK
ncbi:MAG: bifunctional UDP-N-acetylglucosamine diphosphorylase/glucosamine-1-phosphate N-acetyltransferase GlmU [Pseudomonadota bacterium]